MKIVITLIDDQGGPFSREDGLKALRRMLAESTGGDGCLPEDCLELADLEGRALLARVEGELTGGHVFGPHDVRPL